MKYLSVWSFPLAVGILASLPGLYESTIATTKLHKAELVEDEFDKHSIDEELKNEPTAASSSSNIVKDSLLRAVNSIHRMTADDGGDADKKIPCASDDADYLHMIQLTPELKFHWTLDPWSENSEPKVRIKLQYSGTAWIGFGVSNSFGTVIGSDAVIGRSDLTAASGEKPLKYDLTSWSSGGAKVMDSTKQTLQDASLTQSGGQTVLKFTKLLEEKGEVYIRAAGHTNCLFAIGDGNDFDKPARKGSFRLDFSRCDSIGMGTYKGAWIAHGTFATLAWAVASPFAISTAWFRTLVPSSWIYIHVGANILSFVFTLIAFFIAVITMGLSKKKHFQSGHHNIGLALMILVTFQVCNGFLRPPVERDSTSPDDQSKNLLGKTSRQWWHLSHSTLGIGLVGLGFYQISQGYDMFANDFTVTSLAPYFYVYLGILALGLLGIRVWMLYEDYEVEKNTAGVTTVAPEQKRMTEEAVSRGIDPNSDLAPIQFSIE